jgi:GPH family glycoside/pentoside/hexuronide:cation symporter
MVSSSASSDRVSWPLLLAYGSGGIIPIALFNIAGQLMGLIGNIGLGLSAFWLGVIMIFPRLWDAFSDPIMGHLTDNSRTRWGRRRPFILLGGIAVSVTFVLMWWIPEGEMVRNWFPSEAAFDWFRLSYILFWLLFFFTACTVFEIPHGALGMEMSTDTHERTRLFSAKSFLGNIFALGTPWLFFLANLEVFRGADGNEADGMRWVSLLVAAIVIPLSLWWFTACREPNTAQTRARPKTKFWDDIRITFRNRTFLILVGIFFILGMGFNFVALLNYYISIFYLFAGDKLAASPLLGITGSVWAVTALVAVFPLNWLGRRYGKRHTLLIAILLMCAAQLSKIVCYNPENPYLIIIPTILLSGGMLMFFTLGPSMLSDICDEDELKTGTRSEGSYYSIYWWFFKMGTTFASFVTGSLILFSQFDEKQTSKVDELNGSITRLEQAARNWMEEAPPEEVRLQAFQEELATAIGFTGKLNDHFTQRLFDHPENQTHLQQLLNTLGALEVQLTDMEAQPQPYLEEPALVVEAAERLQEETRLLTLQKPSTLLWLRIIEIGLPLVMSFFSITLTLFYPLTEARCLQVKAELDAKRQASS